MRTSIIVLAALVSFASAKPVYADTDLTDVDLNRIVEDNKDKMNDVIHEAQDDEIALEQQIQDELNKYNEMSDEEKQAYQESMNA